MSEEQHQALADIYRICILNFTTSSTSHEANIGAAIHDVIIQAVGGEDELVILLREHPSSNVDR